ncbi:mechanosensitive ion channel family protein [Glycomyces sp. A-F 0318]|uniref:mechanosensitive ion channel family protein n=1 Tax=Glycomyces amatae TaxID=2881355 RepID=UPI001E614CF7|nr:mechanosensitive ion channel family protein [Glycomyces amatae]MCD0443884.1 mechanosensitive ion channel family protein [Glycomyces amatae]
MPNLAPWLAVVLVAVLSAVTVSLARLLVKWLLLRHASERQSLVVGKALRPAQLMAATGGVQILLFAQSDVAAQGWDDGWNISLSRVLMFGTVISGAWLVSNLLSVWKVPLQERWGSLNENDVGGRRRRTQAIVTYRLVAAGVWMVAAGIILFNIPSLKVLGTSLLGAAGVAGVIAALAAQTMLQNLFAGMQLAFGDALRLEDVVVIEGEWGRIEEITLSYVVVRIWDERRLVLPTSYFKTHPYVNWTRNDPAVLGTILLDADWRLPVDQARAELLRYLGTNPLWDGRSHGMEVNDATGPYMRLRMTISAANPSHQWTLRCDVREHMIRWIVDEHPHCIPRMRVNSYQSVMDVRSGVFPDQQAEAQPIEPSEVQMLLSEAPFRQRSPAPES